MIVSEKPVGYSGFIIARRLLWNSTLDSLLLVLDIQSIHNYVSLKSRFATSDTIIQQMDRGRKAFFFRHVYLPPSH